MQPQFAFDPSDPSFELDERSRARGLQMSMITTPETVRRHPLLSSAEPGVLVGPLFTQAMLIDDLLAVVGGPRDVDGAITAWTSTDPAVVGLVRRIWDHAESLATPINPDGVPPLNRRQVLVARRITLGDTDRAIARALGVSLRTVERDASALLALLGARNRAEAVLLMQGRGSPRG
ncbi:helix-turn-helix transcriptional regulator [Nocardioides mesophilus]|nr:LuxR C-terminal-related transcriptional regulator [Nocardioides mesophilus]